MDPLRPEAKYRRNLNHYFEKQGPYFFTFNLHGSIPKQIRDLRLRQIDDQRQRGTERRWFAAMESFLHRGQGPLWLANTEIALIVRSELHRWDGVLYELQCYTLMPNHVHLILTPRTHADDGAPFTVAMIMHALKRRSGLQANRVLGRSGSFWQHESFDRYIRSSAEYNRCVNYILDNPVKAGLVQRWDMWPWSFLRQS